MNAVELVLLERCHELAWQMVRLERQFNLAFLRHDYARFYGLFEERNALQHERSLLLREIWSKRRETLRHPQVQARVPVHSGE
jgi:hypothetical protein